jgi:DNA primase
MESNYRIERSLSDRIRIGDNPFKRRRRRAAACSFLFLAGLSTVNAFVSFPFNTVSLQRLPHQRDGRLLHLSNADPFGEEAKGGATYGKYDRIPSEQLERLKESVDIVSVIESYGLQGFQRQGDHRAKATCPFHNDHNPSLRVDNQRGIYKCFSCGAGGNVFNFVREYSALKSVVPMTFYQAVRHVAQEFGAPNLQLDFVFSSSAQSRMSDDERKALSEKKQRLLLANAAAAAFYGKCLITMPAAGVARSHVQARGLSPTTVQAFAMGYAPDAYFRVKGQWGKDSLVHHLRDLGFKPREIIEVGLATRTKGFQRKSADEGNVVATDSGNNATSLQAEEKDDDDDYDTLIDRFRNRLVVPIFDGKGAIVLGFGGRILPPEENDDSGYKSPKYINSPESPVFHKKDVIFGQYSAGKTVAETRNSEGNGESGPGRGSVVIVEGYMDAIALWEAGVREVVASMGTALTMEQLANAARTAGTRGGEFK